MNKKFFKLFFIVDTIVVVVCLLLQKYLWLLNIQIAFISSLIITIGSFYGYKKNIQNRVNLTDNQFLNNTTDNHQSFSVCFGCCVHIERNKIADHHTLSIFRIPHLITF